MNDFLERRELGKTGLQSSRLGIGSTFDASARVIEEAFDRGINYLYWGRCANQNLPAPWSTLPGTIGTS